MSTVLDDAVRDLSGQRVVVVGGGILGTMHAFVAVRRGATVIHVERDALPHGATVRNFGLIWVSGRASGRELTLALKARDQWETISQSVPGVGFRANGSLTLLASEGELAVAERAVGHADASERGLSLLRGDEVRRRNPALEGMYLGALWCAKDAAVESRVALGALRDAMASTERYEFLPSCDVVGLGESSVVDHRGDRHSGDRVVLCFGAILTGFAAELLDGEPLRRTRLHMAETEPFGRALTTSVADGDTFRYYPAYLDDAHELLEPQDAYKSRYAMQMLCQQRLNGSITIGDTHELNRPGVFETVDWPIDRIADTARHLIGYSFPRIERRWSGVYDQLSDPGPDDVYLRKHVSSSVIAVTGAGGRGMTTAPAIAEESFT